MMLHCCNNDIWLNKTGGCCNTDILQWYITTLLISNHKSFYGRNEFLLFHAGKELISSVLKALNEKSNHWYLWIYHNKIKSWYDQLWRLDIGLAVTLTVTRHSGVRTSWKAVRCSRPSPRPARGSWSCWRRRGRRRRPRRCCPHSPGWLRTGRKAGWAGADWRRRREDWGRRASSQKRRGSQGR